MDVGAGFKPAPTKRHMIFDPKIHHRRSIRLKGYDYSLPGAYFVTICTQNKICLFGNVNNEEMALNDFGRIVQMVWDELPVHYQFIKLDTFIIMPNHVHGIIGLVGAGLKPAPTGLPEIVRGFKTFSARYINKTRNTPGISLWQRNYYEHIIRNPEELNRIREYIVNNPLKWHLDRENPNGIPDEEEKKFWEDFS